MQNDIAKQSLIYLEENNLVAWADNMMHYYDKTYSKSNEQRNADSFFSFDLNDDMFEKYVNEFILENSKNNNLNFRVLCTKHCLKLEFSNYQKIIETEKYTYFTIKSVFVKHFFYLSIHLFFKLIFF